VPNLSGPAWSAGKGIIAALWLADDTRGAGQGLRLLQSTAAVSSGARGGPLPSALLGDGEQGRTVSGAEA
jgi:hypothetical protein